MVTITKEVDVDLDVDIEDFSTDDLIDESESRGYAVIPDHEVDVSENQTLDQLHNLYYSYLQDSREVFERKLQGLLSEKLSVNIVDLRLI